MVKYNESTILAQINKTFSRNVQKMAIYKNLQ